MPSVGVLRCCFNIAVSGLFLDLPQFRAEPGHVLVAAQVGDCLPWQVSDLREENRDGVPAELPGFVVVESLGGDLQMEWVDSHGESCGRRKSEISVGALDDLPADEVDSYSALQGVVAIVLRCPALREFPNLT